MPDVRPDPKPVTEGGIGRKKPAKGARTRGRKVATITEWAAIRVEKIVGQTCRLGDFGQCYGALEAHHVVSRGRGGDDVADNIAPLCHYHHQCVTQRDSGPCRYFAESLTDAEYAYVVGKLGEGGPERLFGVSR